MTEKYNTIKENSEGLFKDRGSKFLAFVLPVKNEDDIREHLDLLRKKYHDARHHCYAWKLGIDPGMSRANDDGEPSNSAGRPILNQIEKYELTNILIVVVRYFGGTLLGVGGLINAYRSATEDAINNGTIITEYVYKSIQLQFEYPLMNAVMKVVKDFQLESSDQDFQMDCRMKIHVRLDKFDKVMGLLDLIEGCTLRVVNDTSE